MEFISELFASFTQEESVIFLVLLLGAFLIGFVLAWILWGGRISRLRKELQKNQGEMAGLKAEYDGFKEQYELKEADLQKAILEAEEAQRARRKLQEEKGQLYAELQVTRDKYDKLQTTAESYEKTIDDVNDQVLGLKARTRERPEYPEQSPADESSIELLSQMQSSFNAALTRLSSLEEKLGQIEAENDELRQELNEIRDSTQPLNADGPIVIEGLARSESAPEPEADPTPDATAARAYVQEALGNTLPAASAEEKDDLKLIHGIGPFIESQLNEVGIYTYEQIAAFDHVMIEQVTTAIAFFPGRIERDDWVGQAARLAAIKEEQPEALQPSAVYPNNPEDLKIVEGIGPKIEQILKAAGINTWKDLAETEPDKLRTLLDQAGDRFRMHDPSTWPQQAQLAANSQWEMLKEYQDFLVGGRDPGE